MMSSILLSFLLLFGNHSNLGGIEGKVVDAATGKPIVGVNVFLESPARVTKTAEDGRFVFSDLAPGSYTLMASLAGYFPTRVKDVLVKSDSITYIDLQLYSTAAVDTITTLSPTIKYRMPIARIDTTKKYKMKYFVPHQIRPAPFDTTKREE